MKLFRQFAVLLALITLFSGAPAYAGPLAALVPIVIGAVVKSMVVKLVLTLAASVALSFLQKALQKKPRAPGIKIEQTLTGGTNPRTIILGTYCTAGSQVAPAMSYGQDGETPNSNLVKVIALTDVPIDGFSRLIMNGEYITLIDNGTNGAGGKEYGLGGKYANKGTLTVYDGRQVNADPSLVTNLGAYPNRPWLSSRVGTGVAYAILKFVYDTDIYKQEPECKFEVRGMRLYDVRKDSSNGGSGLHRWENPATWEFTQNPMVQCYNILRGITLPGGLRWGGECAFEDLPLANWVAAMNVCDENVEVVTIGITEPRYRAAYEFSVDEEPADILEELMKAASATMMESAGVYRVRCGPPGLPIMFVTDENFIVTKEQDYDPFPGIAVSHNTVSAVFPHPGELWATHDAPRLTVPNYLDEDDGIELNADIQFPACPFPNQVQRNMRAWLQDDRRWRRHTASLGPRAFALEPLDVIAWTSVRNGYINKAFEINLVGVDLYTLVNQLVMREVDPGDYDWIPDFELDDPIAPGGWELPEEQAVPGFTVQAWSIKDGDSDERRPAIRVTWDVLGAVDATALRIQVRLAGPQDAVADVSIANVGDGETIISEGILSATAYEVRGQYQVDRPTVWTVWHGVITGELLLGPKDFNFDELVEALGESIAIPNILRPIDDLTTQQIIDLANTDIAIRDTHIDTDRIFGQNVGNRVGIRTETTQRLTEDEALAQQITTVEASLADEVSTRAAAIIEEQTARADADSALASDITTVAAAISDETSAREAAITAEQTARADADGALASSITTVSAALDDEVSARQSAVLDEQTARVSADEALASDITTVQAAITDEAGTRAAAITAEQTARANADEAIASDLETLQAAFDTETGTLGAAITAEQTARADADEALASDITAVAASVTDEAGTRAAAITAEQTARANGDTANATSITNVSARLDSVGGPGVSVETVVSAQASSITGLQAQYTVRINVNGRVTGFGLATGAGGTTEFAILADRFIVVDPSNNSVLGYPFQVVGGAVYIRKAFIQSITTEQIAANAITAGKISVSQLSAITADVGLLRTASTGARVEIEANMIRVYDASGNLRVRLGIWS